MVAEIEATATASANAEALPSAPFDWHRSWARTCQAPSAVCCVSPWSRSVCWPIHRSRSSSTPTQRPGFVAAAEQRPQGPLNVVAPVRYRMQAIRRGRRLPLPLVGPEWRVARSSAYSARTVARARDGTDSSRPACRRRTIDSDAWCHTACDHPGGDRPPVRMGGDRAHAGASGGVTVGLVIRLPPTSWYPGRLCRRVGPRCASHRTAHTRPYGGTSRRRRAPPAEALRGAARDQLATLLAQHRLLGGLSVRPAVARCDSAAGPTSLRSARSCSGSVDCWATPARSAGRCAPANWWWFVLRARATRATPAQLTTADRCRCRQRGGGVSGCVDEHAVRSHRSRRGRSTGSVSTKEAWTVGRARAGRADAAIQRMIDGLGGLHTGIPIDWCGGGLMTYARAADGARIHYEAFGRRGSPPVLMIQGLGADKHGWDMQRFSLRHYRVIAFDNRGAGRSDKPFGVYSIEQMADDAIAVLDHAGVVCARRRGIDGRGNQPSDGGATPRACCR